jgi:hypothetical protein
MSEYENDPAGNTQQFRAFAHRGSSEPATRGGNTGLIVGVAAAVALVAVVVILAVAVL